MSHPYQSTVDLLRRLVGRLPPKFPPELGRCMALRIEEAARDFDITHEQLSRLIAEFGLYLWHYRRAFEEILARDGAPQWEGKFLELLPAAVRERVRTDAGAGSGPVRPATEIMRFPTFESAYSPEEKLIIEEALLASHQAIEEALCAKIERDEIEDYEQIALHWKQRRLKMEEQLLRLRALAKQKPQWTDEISGWIAQFEEGLAGLGRELTLAELEGAVADYANRAS